MTFSHEEDPDALFTALKVIIHSEVVDARQRNRILASLHTHHGWSYRRLAEIVGRDQSTVRDWVMRVPADEMDLAIEPDWRRTNVVDTVAYIQKLLDGSYRVVTEQELETFLAQIIARGPGSPDGPTDRDWTLAALRHSITQALQDRTLVSPIALAFVFRQGMALRQWRKATLGVDPFDQQRDIWLDWVVNLFGEALERHPDAVEHWVCTGIVSLEESLEMFDWYVGVLADLPNQYPSLPPGAKIPFDVVEPIMLVVRRAADNRSLLTIKNVNAAIEALEPCRQWIIDQAGSNNSETYDRLSDYLSRLADEVRERQDPPLLLVSYTEAVETLEWMIQISAHLPDMKLGSVPYQFTGPPMLVAQRAVLNRSSLTQKHIDVARKAVEGGVAWTVKKLGTDTNPYPDIYNLTVNYLDRLEAEIQARQNLPQPPESQETP